MRLRLILAAVLLALPLSASAGTINATLSFNAAGVRTGAPIVAAPGDVVNLTISLNPLSLGIGAYGFAFDATPGIEIQTLSALQGGSSSVAVDKRVFSFNNALSQDLTALTDVATMVFNVDPSVVTGSVTLRSGGEIVRGDFSSVAPQSGLVIEVIPEPGTALLMGAGLMGLGLARRRSA